MSDLAMVLPSFLGSAWRALVGRAVSQSMGVGNDENKRRRDEKLGPVIARDVASFFSFFFFVAFFFFFYIVVVVAVCWVFIASDRVVVGAPVRHYLVFT